MMRCQNCKYRFSVHEVLPDQCPRCGMEWRRGEQDAPWASIARLTNLAEVGYFADILESCGIPTQVRQHNEFSAVDGTWQSIYVLRVPKGSATHAAQSVREELERTSDDPSHGADPGHGGHGPTGGRGFVSTMTHWKPVVFALLAGGLFYTTRHVGPVPQKSPNNVSSLWKVLSNTDRVFVTEKRDGAMRSRLVTDRQSGTVWLEDDLDGDGHFDRLRCFREGRLVGEINR